MIKKSNKMNAFIGVRIPQELADKIAERVQYNGQISDLIREALTRHLIFLEARERLTEPKIIPIRGN